MRFSGTIYLVTAWILIHLAACAGTRSAPTASPTSNSEWLPGRTILEVRESLGSPDTILGNLFLYRKQGLLIYSDPSHTAIRSVVGTWFPGVGRFSGSLLSLRLGDPYPLAEKRLGIPLERYPLHHGIDEAVWKVDRFTVKIEIWLQDDFEPDLGGTIYAETIKRIQVG